jgi:flavodoxin
MRFLVKYQSRGGNTRAVAETIANTLGVTAEPADAPINENVDVLFIGGGFYIGRIDEKLKDCLEKLPVEKIGKIIPFGTSGGRKAVIKQILEYAVKKGIKADERSLYVPMWLKGNGVLGFKGGKLSDKQIKKITEFAKSVMREN